MHHLLYESLLLITCASAAVGFAVRFRVPPVLGFLIVGIVLGTYSTALSISDEGVKFLAELGIVFMLFLVGLELSIEKIIELRRIVFTVGGLQMLICTALSFILFYWGLNWNGMTSLVVASALSMSSTALVLKVLSERGELLHHHGRNSVAILIFQDMAAIPLLVLIAALATFNIAEGLNSEMYLEMFSSVGYALLRATGLFILMYLVGKYVLAGAVKHVIDTQSEEFRLLFILTIILGAAYLADIAGASMPLGAFLAGITIGETKFAHEFEIDIKPFRNVLLGLFFISLGTQFDISSLVSSWDLVLTFILVLSLVKASVIFMIFKVIGKPANEAISTALIMAQGGEFGLLIASLAFKNNLLGADISQPLIVSIILSMAIAPILINRSTSIASRFDKEVVKKC